MRSVPKILIVDDEPDIAQFIRHGLKSRGYQTMTAQTGEMALEIAQECRPDLVLMDVVLPGMSGFQACREIKTALGSFTPVILVTVKSDIQSKIQGIDHGGDDFLTKPFVMEELLTKIRSMLRIKKLHDELERSSITDSLTGIFNRRYFQARLNEECERSRRNGKVFSCLMFDLDHFKKINDTYGHPVGDMVLKHLVKVVSHLVRKSDIFIRYGGEEFVIILPETPLLEAMRLANFIRIATENNPPAFDGDKIPVTCSFGICSFPTRHIRDFNALVNCMDNALYQAKEAGRNCIHVYSRPDGSNGQDLLISNS